MLRVTSKIYSSSSISQDSCLGRESSITDIFISSSDNRELVVSDDDENRGETDLKRLLEVVSKKGLKALDLTELELLRTLLRAKNYSDKKAIKSKEKLLKQINSAFYDSHNPRRFL